MPRNKIGKSEALSTHRQECPERDHRRDALMLERLNEKLPRGQKLTRAEQEFARRFTEEEIEATRAGKIPLFPPTKSGACAPPDPREAAPGMECQRPADPALDEANALPAGGE